MCTYNPPITPQTPNPYGQIIIVNKIYYSYLHVKSGAVCPQAMPAIKVPDNYIYKPNLGVALSP